MPSGGVHPNAFPVEHRFLTRGTRLMLHERQMSGSIDLSGPLTNLPVELKAKLHEIEQSVLIQEEGFRAIVNGSKVTFETLREKARSNWYIDAEEARELGLVLDVI